MDESKPKKIPGTGKGSGRKPGSKNKLTIGVKQSMAQFFTNLTSENLAWRQRVERILTSKTTARDDRTDQSFRAWSSLAMERTLGTPGKAVIEKPQRDPLVFVQYRMNDPMAAKTTAMILAKDREDRLLAIEEGRPDLSEIRATGRHQPDAATKPPEAEETLESVVIPPEFFEPPRPVRERDRLPRGER